MNEAGKKMKETQREKKGKKAVMARWKGSKINEGDSKGE